MQLTHSFTVPAPVEVAWETFMDLEKVGGCFPGATITEVSDDSFSGTVKVKLGPIALVYSGSGKFLERDDAAHRAVIEAQGKDKRGNGTAGATVTIELAPDGGGTRAQVTTELAVTGKPAQFGRGVMQDVSDKLLGQFVGCIEQQLGPSQADAVTTDEQAADEQAADEVAAAWATDESADEQAADEVATAWAAEPRDTPTPTPSSRGESDSRDDHIDLGAVAGPVLAQRYAGYGAAAVVGAVIGWLVGRGSRG